MSAALPWKREIQVNGTSELFRQKPAIELKGSCVTTSVSNELPIVGWDGAHPIHRPQDQERFAEELRAH